MSIVFPTVNNANGTFEAYSNAVQAQAAPVTGITVEIPSSVARGDSATLLSLAAQTITVAQTTVARVIRFDVNVTAASTLSETLTLSLVSDPGGAATVVAATRANTGAANGYANIHLQATVSIAAGAALTARTFGLKITAPGGDVSVGIAAGRGVTVIAEILS